MLVADLHLQHVPDLEAKVDPVLGGRTTIVRLSAKGRPTFNIFVDCPARAQALADVLNMPRAELEAIHPDEETA